MGIVPKGPRAGDDATGTDDAGARVRSIDSAKSRGGRPSGLGYDPTTAEEYASETYRGDDGEVFASYGKRGYSEDRFYIRSVNVDGHGERITIRFPQGIDSQVYAAVQEISEYRSIQDFFRDAAMHRLEYLQRRYRLTPQTQRLLQLERFAADRERRANEIQTNTDTVRDLQAKLETAWGAKDYNVFAEELEEGKQMLEWMREPYHGEVVGLLKEWTARGAEVLARMDSHARE